MLRGKLVPLVALCVAPDREALSAQMRRIRKRDTKPELVVRRLVHSLGYRYRLYRRDLPDTPDLVFPRLRKIIFVHGCFWHQHDCRLGSKQPSSNQSYWLPKLSRNVQRDRWARARLVELGWDVLVWECETRAPNELSVRVACSSFQVRRGPGRKGNWPCLPLIAAWDNLVRFGEFLCKLVISWRSRNPTKLWPRRSRGKRFTVSVEEAEYAELRRTAQTHRPRLSLQYVVRYALQKFIDENKGKQLSLKLSGD